MKIGYNLETWERLGCKLPISAPIHSHIHYLITGSSGSGKSYALKYLLSNLIDEGCIITFCDFKKSDDFVFLNNYDSFFSGDDVENGILKFYKKFVDFRQNSRKSDHLHILIIDEYPSFLLYLSSIDKVKKTKRAEQIKQCISELLMLGRGLGFGVWIVTQRSDASYFSNGSRDNFMTFLLLGRTSREQWQMLLSGEKIPERIYRAGEGIILLDGFPLHEIKFPRIMNLQKLETKIRNGF